MRTKGFFFAAAFAGIVTTAVAQSNVYSLNVVGYYNLPVAANQKVLLGNQLHTTNDTLGGVIPNPPPLSQFFKFANGGFTGYQFDDVDLAWKPDPNVSLAPGEAGFFVSPVNTTLTFVGEVLQGSLTNPLPLNKKVFRCVMVPLAGPVSRFALPVDPLDLLYKFSGGYTAYQFDDVDLVWVPNEPSVAVGEGFVYVKDGPHTNWVFNFTVQ